MDVRGGKAGDDRGAETSDLRGRQRRNDTHRELSMPKGAASAAKRITRTLELNETCAGLRPSETAMTGAAIAILDQQHSAAGLRLCGARSRLRREQLRHQFVNSPLTTTPAPRLPAPTGCRKSEKQRCRIWLSQEFRRSRFKTVVHASIATRDIAGSTGHSLRGRCGINPIDRHVRSRADAATTLASSRKNSAECDESAQAEAGGNNTFI